MLPVVLAPAALVVLAPPSAVQGPAIHGLVVNQAGKPLPATLGLVPMSQREELFPSKTVENRTARTRKAGPGFELRAPAPGLYLLLTGTYKWQPLGFSAFGAISIPMRISRAATVVGSTSSDASVSSSCANTY